jgi:hypothetical protein
VEIPDQEFGTEGSIMLWAYREGGAQYLFDASPGSRTLLYAHYDLYMNDVHLGNIDGELIPDGEWTQLVLTWDNALEDGMREKIYKNGDLYATFDVVLPSTVPALIWLGNRYSNNEPWIGGIDEYALWDTALTRDEIGWLYQNPLAGLPGAYIPEPATSALFALGGLALLRRRRKSFGIGRR